MAIDKKQKIKKDEVAALVGLQDGIIESLTADGKLSADGEGDYILDEAIQGVILAIIDSTRGV